MSFQAPLFAELSNLRDTFINSISKGNVRERDVVDEKICIDSFIEWAIKQYRDDSGVESQESIKNRLAELSHWTHMYYTCVPKDITLLEASYSEDGTCSWVAFSILGAGFEVNFKEHTISRNNAYDLPKAV